MDPLQPHLHMYASTTSQICSLVASHMCTVVLLDHTLTQAGKAVDVEVATGEVCLSPSLVSPLQPPLRTPPPQHALPGLPSQSTHFQHTTQSGRR